MAHVRYSSVPSLQDSSFFNRQMSYCLSTLLVHMALDFNSVNDFVYAISKLDLIQIDFNYKTQAFG